MVDALASGASTGNGVEVRVLSWAPILQNHNLEQRFGKIVGKLVDLSNLLPNFAGSRAIAIFSKIVCFRPKYRSYNLLRVLRR